MWCSALGSELQIAITHSGAAAAALAPAAMQPALPHRPPTATLSLSRRTPRPLPLPRERRAHAGRSGTGGGPPPGGPLRPS